MVGIIYKEKMDSRFRGNDGGDSFYGNDWKGANLI